MKAFDIFDKEYIKFLRNLNLLTTEPQTNTTVE